MSSVLDSAAGGRGDFLERLLPLKPWLGADSTDGIEEGQSRTRLACALIGLCGFVVIGCFVNLPAGIAWTAALFPLYAIGYAMHVRLRPAPTHARRAAAVLADNAVLTYIASFGDMFAAYIGFYFLSTVGWGLRFGRHYLFLTTVIAIAGMAGNLMFTPYWRDNAIFGTVLIIAMLANTINVSILLGRIASGNRRVAEKMEEISRLAWQDPLTKLPNRLYFNEHLSQTLAAAERGGRGIALILFDIDGFKAVNDTLGHEAGDRLLEELAQRLGRRIRQADTFARLGGDEFVIVMDPAGDRSQAALVAEAVLKAMAEIELFAERGLRVGASVGIAYQDATDTRRRTPDELLKQADDAMYAAKRAGKGCYRFAEPG
jgi:diguanylate cyclase (GGDEF)-like protein